MDILSVIKDVPRTTAIVVAGPTASGKSSVALHGAMHDNGCIINADSMQLYEGLPLLTAMPTKEDRQKVDHMLYEVLPMYSNTCSVAQWVHHARQCIETCFQRGQRPWIVGGTGFYIHALMTGLSAIPDIDPAIKTQWRHHYADMTVDQLRCHVAAIDPEAGPTPYDRHRLVNALVVYHATGKPLSFWHQQPKQPPPFVFHTVLIDIALHDAVDLSMQRWLSMVDHGVYNEVASFTAHDKWRTSRLRYALGLETVKHFLDGTIDESTCHHQYKHCVKQYIKRQKTWLRSKYRPHTILLKKPA